MGAGRRGRWARRIGWGLLVLVIVVVMAIWFFLRGSLAQLDGKRTAPGLQGAVTVTRDALGMPSIAGGDRLDVAYATGFVHAQDRYFQMDLLRRVAAGELAELFGPKALPVDREHRLHRFRARAALAYAALDEGETRLAQGERDVSALAESEALVLEAERLAAGTYIDPGDLPKRWEALERP